MTALLVLLLAVASVLNSCVQVGWRLRGLRLAVGLLAAASVLTVLGVLVGWPILHVRGGGVVAVVLMSVAWLCWDLVPQRWWARLPGSRQQSRLGSEGPREDLSHVLPLVRLACTALLFLVVAVCALVSEPLGSRAAKVAAAVGVAVFLTAPANRIVSDILLLLASPRGRMRNRMIRGRQCAVVVGSVRLSEFSFSCSPPSRRPLLSPQLLLPRV